MIFQVVVLTACDGGGAEGGADAAVDAALEMSELFGPCQIDAQCPGEGAVCRTAADGYPRGYCTLPCDDRTPCDHFGVYHHCATRQDESQAFCEQRCLNGLDCGRDGYTCAGELPPSGGICVGVCSRDEECGDGSVCDPYTTKCVPAVTSAGAVTGEACSVDDDCRSGQCVAEVNAGGQPTGWVQGYCVSHCILPPGYNNNDFFAGDALPRGGCEGDAICLPADFAQTAQRDLGRCYAQCSADGDCRPGYTCLQDISLANGGSSRYSNGLCVPRDCRMGGCPTGYTCQTVMDSQGNARGVCGR